MSAVDQHHESEVHHPGWQEYTIIGVILTVITAVEVAIVYVEALEDILLALLLTLGVVKFVMVILWYMHLKQDHKLFTLLFLGGLIMALGVIGGLLAMFHYLPTDTGIG